MGSTGYIGVLVAVLFFGSNFVPLKRIKIGDGVFFQFIMCTAIFMTSIPVLIVQGFPEMHGLAILGGFLWCTGNMLCPIAIRLIGMGLGLLVWGSVGMIIGWASGTYGLFGLNKQDVQNPALNVAGVVVSMIGLLVFLQVRTKDTSVDNQKRVSDDELFSDMKSTLLSADETGGTQHIRGVVTENSAGNSSRAAHDILADGVPKKEDEEWNANTKRIVGLLCAVGAGIFFGCAFDPSQYVIDHDYDGSDNTLNYVFPHYTGILITSWGYTVAYCAYHYLIEKEPYINTECILPATLSGLMWGIANIGWFYANGELGFSITYPIISSGPGFIGSLWGIFVFKEITGFRDIAVLCVAFAITLPALIMVGLSH